jgi:hypothetical protein
VKNESVYLRATDSSAPPEEVKLDRFVESSFLTVYELSGDTEKGLYVDYAAELDDGEAMSLALVHSRGLTLASDDRKARRIFMEIKYKIALLGRKIKLQAQVRCLAWSSRARRQSSHNSQIAFPDSDGHLIMRTPSVSELGILQGNSGHQR